MEIQLEEAIRDFPVVSWFSQYAQVYDSGGRNVYADCPICGGKRRLGIEVQKKLFHCFRCDPEEGGSHGGTTWKGRANLFSMIRIVEHLETHAIVSRIYSLAGYPDVPRTRVAASQKLLPKEALPLKDAPATDPAVMYLRKREVPHLQETASVCLEGKYEGRIIFPITFFDEFLGFEAKQINGKGRFPDWFDGYSAVYTSRHWYAREDFAVVTESVIDSETLGSNSIGLLGSSLKEGQLERILKLRERGVKRLVWMLDADAMRKQLDIVMKKTSSFFENYIACLDDGQDPNMIGHEACWERVKTAKHIASEWDLIEIRVNLGI